jgi:hypothetical protein
LLNHPCPRQRHNDNPAPGRIREPAGCAKALLLPFKENLPEGRYLVTGMLHWSGDHSTIFQQNQKLRAGRLIPLSPERCKLL